MSRKVQWATLVAKRAKLQSKVSSLDEQKAELEALEAQMAELITPESITEAKDKLLKTIRDHDRAMETLVGLVTEARSTGSDVEIDEEAAGIVDAALAAEREAADEGTTVELETEPEQITESTE